MKKKMNDFVVATAGHIDHGKTTLIRQLTGIETDTTQEEKERGMSIHLGFAYLDLPQQRIGIVDVPGHERFIRQMIAGLSGIDLVLLTVDVNEGLMPQTKEHLAILSLLQIQDVVFVFTKADTCDEEWVELVQEEVRLYLEKTPYAQAPFVVTDALSGRGLAELKQLLQKYAQEKKDRVIQASARLHVDRSFSVKGFGTVVTGTLMEGNLQKGEEVYCYPAHKKVKIRSIQVHKENVATAHVGQRTALNLPGISVEDVKAGSLITKEEMTSTWMVDIRVTVLEEAAWSLQQWQRVRVLIGTKEVLARLVPLGQDSIAPGETAFAQLRLEEELYCKEGDRFILRNYSPVFTLAGGEIVEVYPAKHRHFDTEVVQRLTEKMSASPEVKLSHYLQEIGQFQTLEELVAQTKEEATDLQANLQTLIEQEEVLAFPEGYLHQKVFLLYQKQIEETLQAYHKKHRLRQGMPEQDLRQQLSTTAVMLLPYLVEAKQLRLSQGQYALAAFQVHYNPYQKKARQKLEQQLSQAGLQTIKIADLDLHDRNQQEVWQETEGELYIKLDKENVIATAAFEQACAVVDHLFAEKEQFTLADFRDASQSSRRASMLILEKMDRLAWTQREEQYRKKGKAYASRNLSRCSRNEFV